jgi:hypothetical protein
MAADCSLVVLEKIVAECEDAEEQRSSFYACPCCRKPQVLNIESLQVSAPLLSPGPGSADSRPATLLPLAGLL